MVKMGIIKECGVSQQFQRGAYIQVQRFRCGKKGFGLKVMENVCKDSFIIEYVGEVCVH
jgi:histone-lysine N-methyltransferase SETD2